MHTLMYIVIITKILITDLMLVKLFNDVKKLKSNNTTTKTLLRG